MIVWQDPQPRATEMPVRETRLAFLIVCNFCAAAALFVALFPQLAESIWR